jgi:hypothetical protein
LRDFAKKYVRRDLCPSFPVAVTWAAHQAGASPAAGACLGRRVVAHFAKITSPGPASVVPRDGDRGGAPSRRESGGGRLPRREEPAPAEAGVVAQFRKKPRPPRPAPVVPRGGDLSGAPGRSESGGGSLPRREGRCAISQKPRPPRPVPVLPRVALPSGPNPAGGLLRNFAKKHVRGRQLAAARHNQPPSPPPLDRTTADAEFRRCPHSARSAILPLHALTASNKNRNRKQRKRNAPQCRRVGISPRSARIIGVYRRSSAARILACLGKPPHRRQQRFARPRPVAKEPTRRGQRSNPPHSSPAAAAARDAGVSISSGATGPVYV